MMRLKDLTIQQIQNIIALKEQIATLQGQIDSIAEGGEAAPAATAETPPAPGKRKYQMSAAHKRKLVKTLAKARAARWAKYNSDGAAKAEQPAKTKKKRRISAAGRAAMAAAGRARWARIKGTTTAVPEVAGKKRRKMSPEAKAKIAAAARARWAKVKAEGTKGL